MIEIEFTTRQKLKGVEKKYTIIAERKPELDRFLESWSGLNIDLKPMQISHRAFEKFAHQNNINYKILHNEIT